MLHIHLLGDFRLNYDGVPVTTVSTPRLQSLLAYLLLHRYAPQSRDQIAFQLWPDSPEARARANLRALVHRLRHSLPEADHFLAVTDQTLHWRPDAPFSLDVTNFERDVEQTSSIAALQEAIALYQGDLWPNCYDDWLLPLRDKLRQAFLGAFSNLIALLEDQQEYRLALSYAQRLLQHDPLREETYGCLMRLHALNGDRAKALRVYQECATVLQRELDVPPSLVTRELYERISAGELERPRREEMQPHRLPVPSHNLPAEPTPLIGRERELTELSNLLAQGECRLVTVTGPGGVGKTRLALAIAHHMQGQFRDGVYFVSLAGLDSAEDILPKLANTLHLSVRDQVAFESQLVDELRPKEMLLLLDNFEHLLPEGTEPLLTLLTTAPQMKLIVTSREALNLRWEWRFDLEGLAYPPSGLPDATHFREAGASHLPYSAVQLFLQIAHRVRPRLSLSNLEQVEIGRICRLVSGLPLGIELAASLTGRVSCADVAAGLERSLDALATSLRDVPPRHRSLRATCDYSWVLLSPEEQAAFKQLSVFRGGFTAEAAEQVAGVSPTMLMSLVDKSLLRQVSPERYNLHEVLRRFAEEKLNERPGEYEQVRDRHQDYYATFRQHKQEFLKKSQQVMESLTEVGAETENMRASWRWAIRQGKTPEMAQAVEGMHGFRLWWMIPEAKRLDDYRQLLEARSSHLGICFIDTVWVDFLAEHLLDLNDYLANEARQCFPVLLENNSVAGKLVAMPFFADVGLLFYRTDLLAKYGYAGPPATWDELEAMAAQIQAGERAEGQADFWGFVWQGPADEALTCNALEWQASHGGGRIIEPDGTISVKNPQAIAAFERAAGWIGAISPPTVTQHALSSVDVWLAGHAVFMRNWPHLLRDELHNYYSASIVRDRFAVTLLPAGSAGPSAVLGGWQLAVSKYTTHCQEAIEVIRYLTSPEMQLQRAVEDFTLPTLPALYERPEVLAAIPYFSQLKEILSGGIVARPSRITGKLYPQVSDAYAQAVHAILTRQVDATTALADLEAKLVALTGFKVGPPS